MQGRLVPATKTIAACNSMPYIMGSMHKPLFTILLFALALTCTGAEPPFNLSWKDDYLTISSDRIPGKEISILYIEDYCRPDSTNRKWEQTTIGHKTRLIESSPHRILLECTLTDGVRIRHEITAKQDEVDFKL